MHMAVPIELHVLEQDAHPLLDVQWADLDVALSSVEAFGSLPF